MTLTDTNDLRERLKPCQTIAEAAAVLSEYGEDCGEAEAAVIFAKRNASDGFVYGEDSSTLCGQVIRCPHCQNTLPDIILANSTELLCANPQTHFGCCSCGTQFTTG